MAWSVAGVISDRAARDSDAVLLREEDRLVTAGDLDAGSSRVAQALVKAGLRPGDRIAYLDRNSTTYYEVLVGAAKSGVVTVGVNWRLSVAEMAYVISDSDAKALFVGAGFAHLVGELHAHLAKPQIPTILLGAQYESWRDHYQAVDPGHEPDEGDAAVQLYTSGTTGASKGVLLSNAGFEFSMGLVHHFGLGEGAVAVVNLPLFHFGGTAWPLWVWAAGGGCVVHQQFDAKLVVQQARDTITTLITVPTMLRTMCDAADEEPGRFDALQTIGYGSAPITESLLQRAMETFECNFLQSYASTETCGIVTQLLPEEHDPFGPRRHLLRSAGRPAPGIEVLTGDARTGRSCAVGEIGNIWVRSPMNMIGYWNKPETTAEVLTEDNWLLTGDLAYFDEDGYLYLADRANEMIITGGENVYPAHVENVLAAHAAVSEIAVVGVANERWGEVVTAVVLRTPGADVTAEELIAFARERIAHYAAPRAVVFVDEELPKNATGKILRREVRDGLSPQRFA